MAPHSSTLAWKTPWTEEPGRLQSMGLLRFGHDWAPSLSLFTFMHWRRKWQPTPVFLPAESQGRRGLVGCRLWGSTESARLKRLSSSSRVLFNTNWVFSLTVGLKVEFILLFFNDLKFENAGMTLRTKLILLYRLYKNLTLLPFHEYSSKT